MTLERELEKTPYEVAAAGMKAWPRERMSDSYFLSFIISASSRAL